MRPKKKNSPKKRVGVEIELTIWALAYQIREEPQPGGERTDTARLSHCAKVTVVSDTFFGERISLD